MDWIFLQLSNGSIEHREWVLCGLLLVAGCGFFPAPLDLLLAATGVLIGKETLPYVETVCLCLLVILCCDFTFFELGKVFGERVLGKKWVSGKFGGTRLEKIEKRLKQSEVKIALTLRFNILLKPYCIFFSSALGLSRSVFYRVHVMTTLLYIPFLLAFVAFVSVKIPLKDWQIIVAIWTVWILCLFVPGRRPPSRNHPVGESAH